jgi:hypothetical protein
MLKIKRLADYYKESQQYKRFLHPLALKLQSHSFEGGSSMGNPENSRSDLNFNFCKGRVLPEEILTTTGDCSCEGLSLLLTFDTVGEETAKLPRCRRQTVLEDGHPFREALNYVPFKLRKLSSQFQQTQFKQELEAVGVSWRRGPKFPKKAGRRAVKTC